MKFIIDLIISALSCDGFTKELKMKTEIGFEVEVQV